MPSKTAITLLGITAVWAEATQSLLNRGCTKLISYGPLSYGEQWECPEVSSGSTSTLAFFDAKLNPFLRPSGGFPVVAAHGLGRGDECGLAPDCSSCVPMQGCVWAANKCLSDVSCRNDPYCADGVTKACDSLVRSTPGSTQTGYSMLVKDNVEIAIQGTFQWPSQTTWFGTRAFGQPAAENPFATAYSPAVTTWLQHLTPHTAQRSTSSIPSIPSISYTSPSTVPKLSLTNNNAVQYQYSKPASFPSALFGDGW